MGTAYIDWSDNNCDWGTTEINAWEYSCSISANGLHAWAYARAECLGCAQQESYCMECGYPGCECGRIE